MTAFEEITKFIKSNNIDARDAIFENPDFMKTPSESESEKFTDEIVEFDEFDDFDNTTTLSNIDVDEEKIVNTYI